MSEDIPALEGENVTAEVTEEATKRNWTVPDDIERRRKKVNVHWNRPKSHLYEYNYDYGANYYKGMIDYLNHKSYGYKSTELPKPLTWAERALRTYAEKREAALHSATNRDVELLHKIRSSTQDYHLRSKSYYSVKSNNLYL